MTAPDFDTAIARYCEGKITPRQLHDIAVAHGKGVVDVWLAIDRYQSPPWHARLWRRLRRMIGGAS